MNAGILYIVATPIGNLKDISLRALEILKAVNLIAAEDTRHSLLLLKHYDINTPLLALHQHNERDFTQKLLDKLQRGENIALISDAGTPLISDPGYHFVHEVRKQEITIIPIPGACAAIAALSAAGLPSHHFVFEGFLPVKQKLRQDHLAALKNEERTLIFYEAPHRILATLGDMAQIFGEEREAVIARELTKLFESIHYDTIQNLLNFIQTHTQEQQGEFVILIHGHLKEEHITTNEEERVLKILLQECSVKKASQLAAEITGKKKNALYQLALKLSE